MVIQGKLKGKKPLVKKINIQDFYNKKKKKPEVLVKKSEIILSFRNINQRRVNNTKCCRNFINAQESEVHRSTNQT